MDSESVSGKCEDNRDADQSRQSLQSTMKDSRASSYQKNKKKFRDKIQDEGEKGGGLQSRSKTRTWHSDPDRDQISCGEERRRSESFYSEDFENQYPSDRSISPYSRSRTPSPTCRRGVRTRRISGSHLYKTGGAVHRGASRPQRPAGQPLTQHHRRGVHSQSKESTPLKDVGLVTKRMLSARLLKINDLRNSLSELQQRIDELQKENRVLRQLQVRQEKALQRYGNTDSEVSQLISRHNNETHMLRVRLRRTQERERAAELRLRDSEEQLHRSQTTNARLRKLVDQRELGARDKLSRDLEEEKTRAQEADRKIKELERSMELSNSSFQRQLAAERKKTISAQEEIGTLQLELERLTNKLKEKERELDTKNIYANRMMKPPLRKEGDSCTKRKIPSRSSTKAASTKDRTSSPDFPTPPPAVTDASESSEPAPDEYLSLKQELDRVNGQEETEDRGQKMSCREKERDKEKELVKEKEEKQLLNQEFNVLEEKTTRLEDGLEKKEQEEDSKTTSYQEEENNRKCGHVQEEVERWNQGALANQQATEEDRRKKDQLLAKMREIDRQNSEAQDGIFAKSSPESNKATSNHSSPRLTEQRNSSIFNLTESKDSASLRGDAGSREGWWRRSGMEGGDGIAVMGRRTPRPQIPREDLAFGSYAPSFGHPASRGFPSPPPKEDKQSALEAIGVFSLRGVETEKDKEMEKGVGKEKKSSLMQQLFGVLGSGDGVSTTNKMEVLNSPPTTNGVRSRRERLFDINSGSSTPPASSLNTLHIADSRPAIRAIASFDDDIEELAL